MAIGPSGGMLKKLFDPANMKKKMKSAMGVAKSGGPAIKRPEMKGTKGGAMKLMNKD
jgi:hypothetical protein